MIQLLRPWPFFQDHMGCEIVVRAGAHMAYFMLLTDVFIFYDYDIYAYYIFFAHLSSPMV